MFSFACFGRDKQLRVSISLPPILSFILQKPPELLLGAYEYSSAADSKYGSRLNIETIHCTDTDFISLTIFVLHGFFQCGA